MDHYWYVIGHKNDFQPNIPKKITINNSPISISRDENNHFVGVSDVIPHRGVSLSKGRVDFHSNCIVCPYNAFKYNEKDVLYNPQVDKMRRGDSFGFKTDIPYYKVFRVKDWIYLNNIPTKPPTSKDIWLELEAMNPSFKLEQILYINTQTVNENSNFSPLAIS